jgi:hypothetical protein
VEAGDLMYFVQRWLMSHCANSDDCGGADINRSGTVGPGRLRPAGRVLADDVRGNWEIQYDTDPE